jgi:hypothetical protein
MPERIAVRMTGGVLLVALLALVALVAKSPNRFTYDELFFAHYASILQEYGFTVKFLRALDAAPGPLSAVVQVTLQPLTHLRPVGMRFVNVSLLVALALILVASFKSEEKNRWVSGFSVLIVPMAWVVGGMALSEISAMVFVTLSLYLQLLGLDLLDECGSPSTWFLAAGASLGIAVWGRQPYLLLGGVPMFVSLLDRRLRPAALVFFSIAAALTIPLFVIWRGLLPPSQHSLHPSLTLAHGLMSFGYAGFCFFLLAPRYRWLPAKIIIALVVLTTVVNASLGAFVIYPVHSLFQRVLPPLLFAAYGELAGSLFLSLGVVFLAALLRMTWTERHDVRRLTIHAGLLCICAAPMLDPHQYSSRYTAMSLPYLILTAQPWRQWKLDTAIAAALGCGIGFMSLYGYFFSH